MSTISTTIEKANNESKWANLLSANALLLYAPIFNFPANNAILLWFKCETLHLFFYLSENMHNIF